MIKIRDFTFRYREGDRPVVSGIDLDKIGRAHV